MDAQTHDNHNHETTGAVAKSGLQLQRAPTYLLLYGFGLSTNLCTGLRPSISSPSSPTPPPVLALLYIVLVPGSGRAGSASKTEADRPDEQWRPIHPRKRRRSGAITYDSLGAEATTSRRTCCGRRRERGARGCGRRIPGRARRAAQGLRCAAPALLGWGEEGAVVVGIGAGLRVFWQDSDLRREKKRFSLQISIFSNESEGRVGACNRADSLSETQNVGIHHQGVAECFLHNRGGHHRNILAKQRNTTGGYTCVKK